LDAAAEAGVPSERILRSDARSRDADDLVGDLYLQERLEAPARTDGLDLPGELCRPCGCRPRSDLVDPEALELLDYVYFGIYTITTSGYGDIVPVSPFAKLITTVANIFEVFLIVVFFNVLISFFNSGPASEERTA
jgi:hypothetical protein